MGKSELEVRGDDGGNKFEWKCADDGDWHDRDVTVVRNEWTGWAKIKVKWQAPGDIGGDDCWLQDGNSGKEVKGKWTIKEDGDAQLHIMRGKKKGKKKNAPRAVHTFVAHVMEPGGAHEEGLYGPTSASASAGAYEVGQAVEVDWGEGFQPAMCRVVGFTQDDGERFDYGVEYDEYPGTICGANPGSMRAKKGKKKKKKKKVKKKKVQEVADEKMPESAPNEPVTADTDAKEQEPMDVDAPPMPKLDAGVESDGSGPEDNADQPEAEKIPDNVFKRTWTRTAGEFNDVLVKKNIVKILDEELGSKSYDAGKIEEWVREINDLALKQVADLKGRKICITTHVAQKGKQGLHATTTALWEQFLDRVIALDWSNETMRVTVHCYCVAV